MNTLTEFTNDCNSAKLIGSDLSDAEIDSIVAPTFVAKTPELPAHIQLWTWLTDRVWFLRQYRGHGQAAELFKLTAYDRAKFVALLADDDVRAVAAKLLLPALDSERERKGGAA